MKIQRESQLNATEPHTGEGPTLNRDGSALSPDDMGVVKLYISCKKT